MCPTSIPQNDSKSILSSQEFLKLSAIIKIIYEAFHSNVPGISSVFTFRSCYYKESS